MDARGYRMKCDEAGDRLHGGWFTGEWDNCRDAEALQRICAAAPEIVALHDKLGDLLIVSWSGYVGDFGGQCHDVEDFLRAHLGHRVAPMNEYGCFQGDTGRCVECPSWAVLCSRCGKLTCEQHHGAHP